MTYQELVSKLKDTYQEKDASKISEHLAIQFNIQGEAEGALYLEIANGQLHVEPYEYYDRDILVTTSAADLLALAQGSLDILEAYQSGKISAHTVDHAIDISGIRLSVCNLNTYVPCTGCCSHHIARIPQWKQ